MIQCYPVVNAAEVSGQEYLPYLFFAYREAPQESTGFFSFELLFRWKVLGPLDSSGRGGNLGCSAHDGDARVTPRDV